MTAPVCLRPAPARLTSPVAAPERATRRLVRQLEALGRTVILEPPSLDPNHISQQRSRNIPERPMDVG
jgi:hypothetical protein